MSGHAIDNSELLRLLVGEPEQVVGDRLQLLPAELRDRSFIDAVMAAGNNEVRRRRP